MALLALSALFGAAARGEHPSPAQFLPISRGVVRVEADREQGGVSVGSGVTVAPSIVATSCHVVRDARAMRIAGSGATWSVKGVHAHMRRDLCFLRVPAWRGRPVRLSSTSVHRPGARVVALGFTGGMAIAPHFGHICAVHMFEGARIIESDTRFNSGSSGGGLFDEEGALIGLLTFRLRNSVDNFYSIPVRWIRELMPQEHHWMPVGPLKGGSPFWQGEGDELPEFMRATVPEAGSCLRLIERAEAALPTDKD